MSIKQKNNIRIKLKDLKSRHCVLGQTTSIRFCLMIFFFLIYSTVSTYSNQDSLLANRSKMHNISGRIVVRCLTKLPFDPLNHSNWSTSNFIDHVTLQAESWKKYIQKMSKFGIVLYQTVSMRISGQLYFGLVLLYRHSDYTPGSFTHI